MDELLLAENGIGAATTFDWLILNTYQKVRRQNSMDQPLVTRLIVPRFLLQ